MVAARPPSGAGSPASEASGLKAVAAELDTAALPLTPYSDLHMLLEKTLLRADVLTLEIRVGPGTADTLRALARAGHDARGDSAAAAIVHAGRAWAKIVFQRGVSLGQFEGGVRDNLERVVRAGWVSRAHADTVIARFPRWFSFLADGGARKGDTIFYRMRDGHLRTVYVSRTGQVLLDTVDNSSEAAAGVLGSYLAPGSDFRGKLLRSLPGR